MKRLVLEACVIVAALAGGVWAGRTNRSSAGEVSPSEERGNGTDGPGAGRADARASSGAEAGGRVRAQRKAETARTVRDAADDAAEVEALRAEVARLKEELAARPVPPLPDGVHQGPVGWYARQREFAELKARDPDSYGQREIKEIISWRKNSGYLKEELAKYATVDLSRLTEDEARDYTRYCDCRREVGDLGRVLSPLNDTADAATLHAAHDRRWGLFLETEKLTDTFRKVQMDEACRKGGMDEARVREARDVLLDVFDLTRTPSRLRCPRK